MAGEVEGPVKTIAALLKKMVEDYQKAGEHHDDSGDSGRDHGLDYRDNAGDVDHAASAQAEAVPEVRESLPGIDRPGDERT